MMNHKNSWELNHFQQNRGGTPLPVLATAERLHGELTTAERVHRQPMARPVLATAEGIQQQPLATVYDLKIYRLLTYAVKFYGINFKSLTMKNVSVIVSQRKSFKKYLERPTDRQMY